MTDRNPTATRRDTMSAMASLGFLGLFDTSDGPVGINDLGMFDTHVIANDGENLAIDPEKLNFVSPIDATETDTGVDITLNQDALDIGGTTTTSTSTPPRLTDPSRPQTSPLETPDTIENQSASAGDTVTLHSINGSGVVRNWWMAIKGGGQAVGDTWFEIIVDGNTDNPIRFDGNSLFGRIRSQDSSHEAAWDVGRLQAQDYYGGSGNTMAGQNLRYPIPYTESIEFKMHVVDDVTYYSIPHAEPRSSSNVPDLRLRSSSNLLDPDGYVTVPTGDSVDFFDIPSGTEGFLAGFALQRDNNDSGARINIEDDINVHLNRESTPSRVSTGSEDFPFYFSWAANWPSYTDFGPTYIGLNAVDASPHVCVWITDFITSEGGLAFDDGLIMRMLHESSSPTDARCAWTGLYYEAV